MSSVLKPTSSKPNLGRNGFDLSQRRIFSCTAGQLLPVFKDFASPGDKYKINSNTFIRTEAVDTCAFMRLKHHLDWFFVPITQLYMFWNEFFYGTDDVMSTFDSEDKSYSLPYTPLYAYLSLQSFPDRWMFTDSVGDHFLLTDEFSIPKIYNACRLMDMLGYGASSRSKALFLMSNDDETPEERWFPVYYLAYHKIFHSHYNNTKYFPNRPVLYNVDKYAGGSIPLDSAFDIISTIHYRPYRLDYFTAIQPAPTFNANFASFVSDSNFSDGSPAYLGVSDGIDNSPIHSKNLSGFGLVPESNLPLASNTTGVSISTSTTDELALGNLRTAFALDRLSRITASAGSHYDDQTLAHFGVKLPQGIKKEAYYLGEQVLDIIINEVVATASTGSGGAGDTLGDIAGKGFGSTSNADDINFEAPCHGVIMGISSIEPIPDYASARVDIENRYLCRFDFYIPEMDNLGMQPIWNSYAWQNEVGVIDSSLESVLGWQPRHTELKIKYDVVNESVFATHRNSWAGYKQSIYDGEMTGSTFTYNPNTYFFVSPQYTNNIFQQEVPFYINGRGPEFDFNEGIDFINPVLSPESMYYYDNFLVNMQMNVYKTSVMSVHSLPKFI